MQKLMILVFISIISLSLGAIDNSKKNGHGLFHGLEEVEGKSSWLKDKVEQSDNSKKDVIITTAPGIGIIEDNRNTLLDNTDAKHSSLYLQPEPRGLQYLLNTGDFNPYVLHSMKKRDTENIQDGILCNDRTILCLLRRKRQLGFERGYYVVPNSSGQAVLYGVPLPNNQFPGNNFNPTFYPNTRNNIVPNNGQSYGYDNNHIGGYKTRGY